MSTWVNMEKLRTDYNLRSVHAIFLLLVVSSVLLGFSYLNEMYQRIQLQEMMERQAKHIEAERSIIGRRASLLQAQIENRNKEMKRLKDVHAFQVEKQNSICEQEMNNLLQTTSSNNYTITELQTENERLKWRFEHLQSVMAEFEKNQSRLLEKFSTQSTQCMNVINMLSKLCNKGKVIRKIAQVTMQNETQSNKTEKKDNMGLISTTTPTKDTTMNSGNETQSSLKAMQKLQELFSELNETNGMKDNEDDIMKLEDTQNPAEKNIFKLQAEEGRHNNETSDEEDLPNNMLIQKQQTGSNEKLPALKKASESEKPNQSRTEKVNNSDYPMLLSKDKGLQLTNRNNIRANEEVTDKPLKVIKVGEDNVKSEDKAYSTEKNLDVPKNFRDRLEKIKKLDEYINKAKGESEYEHQRLTKDSELQELQKLQELFSELNKTNGMKDNEDDIMKLEDTQNPAEKNIFKLQAEEGRNNNETSDEEDLPNNMLIQKQQTGSNEKLPALKEASESEKPNQSRTEKVNNSDYPMLLSKDKSLQLTNRNNIRANKEVTDKPLEVITVGEDNVKREDKAYSTEKNLDVPKNFRDRWEKIKKLEYINKAKGESEYEHQRLTKDSELNDQEILEIIS